jgi:hypothetical protein
LPLSCVVPIRLRRTIVLQSDETGSETQINGKTGRFSAITGSTVGLK